MSALLATEAWLDLLYMDVVGLLGFKAVRRSVLGYRSRVSSTSRPSDSARVTSVIEASKTALALYFRKTKCLHRSAVVTRMLRRHGVDAALVIGTQLPALKAHAWVEVEGSLVSDEYDGVEFFHVLDRW